MKGGWGWWVGWWVDLVSEKMRVGAEGEERLWARSQEHEQGREHSSSETARAAGQRSGAAPPPSPVGLRAQRSWPPAPPPPHTHLSSPRPPPPTCRSGTAHTWQSDPPGGSAARPAAAALQAGSRGGAGTSGWAGRQFVAGGNAHMQAGQPAAHLLLLQRSFAAVLPALSCLWPFTSAPLPQQTPTHPPPTNTPTLHHHPPTTHP